MTSSQGHFASASLYVGDLSEQVSEAMLYEVFNSVGPVASIRVCRDSSSKRSLGYAYVNYHSVGDAERALDTLNFTHIRNVPCRLMWSHRDPSLRKSGSGNIFVKNLDKNIDNKALYDTFSLFGNILSCKVAQDEFGKSRGFGFVHYETEDAAISAIEKVHSMMIGSKRVYVGPFKKSSERSSHTEERFTNVYIKNVPADWTEEKIKELFGECGDVTSVALQSDNRGRVFGFVNFSDAESAKMAVQTLHEKEVQHTEEGKTTTEDLEVELKENKGEELKETSGEKEAGHEAGKEGSETEAKSPSSEDKLLGEDQDKLYVSRFQPRAERVALLKSKFDRTSEQRQKKVGVNLYIKNIHDSVDDALLRELFEPFGAITSAKVMTDENGVSRGFGFVGYLSPEEATRAVTEMHLKLVENKPLYVGLHEKREERMQRLQQRLRIPNMRPRVPQGNLQSQIQFGAPPPMYFSGGMQQQSGAHPSYPSTAGGGMYGGGSIIPPWNRSQPPMRVYGGSGGQLPSGQMMGAGASGGPHAQVGGRYLNMGPQPGHAMGGQGNQVAAPAASIAGFNEMPEYTAPSPMQKQILGERLFPQIQRLQPQLAGKITGMMLDMDNDELLGLLESETHLQAKVEEALRVLRQAGAPPSVPTGNAEMSA